MRFKEIIVEFNCNNIFIKWTNQRGQNRHFLLFEISNGIKLTNTRYVLTGVIEFTGEVNYFRTFYSSRQNVGSNTGNIRHDLKIKMCRKVFLNHKQLHFAVLFTTFNKDWFRVLFFEFYFPSLVQNLWNIFFLIYIFIFIWQNQ